MNTLTFLLSTVIELYTMVLLLRIWMQWAHCDFYNPFSQFVVKVTQPIIGPLRRVIPAMGGIDFSPMLLVLLLYVINMGVAEVLQATGNMLLPGLWMAL
ncbi:YggT family protein [Escherichia coli]|uniref:YggT family protein n=1 Tax=Escherichia coli TaxID=562 RepID=UPI000F632400|nr:YggT family protein [Escherichia coli]MDK7704417.1 YggT family protein [Escherichia coli]RRL37580.1 YggT family protein [Escherichia coli]